MSVLSLVLDMRRVDGNPTAPFLGRFINGPVVDEFIGPRGLGEDFGDGSSECGLAVVDVANGTNVHVRFRARESLSVSTNRA